MAVETKVQASAAAAAVSGLALFVLGRYVFRGAVPDVVASWVYAAVPGVLAFGAGYLARHTARPAAPLPGVTVNFTGTSSAEIGRQVTEAIKAGQRRGSYTPASGPPEPAAAPPGPAGASVPPAAAATEPPAVAGEPPA